MNQNSCDISHVNTIYMMTRAYIVNSYKLWLNIALYIIMNSLHATA
jgi:hypothetical protein